MILRPLVPYQTEIRECGLLMATARTMKSKEQRIVEAIPFVANSLTGSVILAPARCFGLLFFEPDFQFLGSHVDELIELPVSKSVI